MEAIANLPKILTNAHTNDWNKRMILRRKILVPLMGIALLVASGAAIYGETATVTVTGGALGVTASNVTLPEVTLDGTNQETALAAASGLWTATDATGTGVGWHLTATATDFTGGVPLRTIDIANADSEFKIQIASISVGTGSGAAPTNNVSSATAIPDTGSLTFVSAAADGTGMGQYTFTPNFSLETLASTYALASYTSTVTVTAVTGP